MNLSLIRIYTPFSLHLLGRWDRCALKVDGCRLSAAPPWVQGSVQQRRLPDYKEKKKVQQGTSHHFKLIRLITESQRAYDRSGTLCVLHKMQKSRLSTVQPFGANHQKMYTHRWADR